MSRSQPRGLRGPSRVVDPDAFEWTDAGWDGVPLSELVLYELHVGHLHAGGDLRGVIPHLPGCARSASTAIELMPVSEFPGARGWGYDGVYLRAPHHAYGGPDGLRRLVDAAHAEGVGRGARPRAEPPRRLGRPHDEGLRPVLHRQVRDRLGQGDQLRRHRLRGGARVGAAERRIAGARVPPGRAAARRGARDHRQQPAPPAGRAGRSRPRRGSGRPRDRREQPQRPAHDPPGGGGRPRPGRPVGRRLPPRATHAAHGRARGLLPRLRAGRAPGARVRAPLRLRRALVGGAPPPRGGAGRRPAARAVRGLLAEPRPGGQSRLRRPAAAARAAARGVLHAPVAVHPAPVHGRGVGRERALPVLYGSHRQANRARDARGAAQGVRRLRGVRRRGGAGPAVTRDIRALQAHPARRPPARRAVPRAAGAAAAAPARRARDRVRRGCALAARAAWSLRAGDELRRPPPRGARGRARGRARHPRGDARRRPRRAARSAGAVVR